MEQSEFDQIKAKFEAIANAMGKDWSLEVRASVDATMFGAYLKRADGLQICLVTGGYRREGKIEVMPSYPDHVAASDMRLQYTHERDFSRANGGHLHPINCSFDRTPETIAKDINRRFLPAYEGRYQEALAYCREQESYWKRYAMTDEIAKVTFRGINDCYVKHVSAESIRLEVSIPASKAEALADFLKKL